MCMVICISGNKIIKELPLKSRSRSDNTLSELDSQISTLNSVIIEHVLDLLDEVTNHADTQKSLDNMGFVGSKMFCTDSVNQMFWYCREKCSQLPLFLHMLCKTKNFTRYLKGCYSGSMTCYSDGSNTLKCGIESPYPNRIVNGETVEDARKYSWQAGLSYSDHPNYSVSCGGSIITNKHILTAAHCVKDSSIFFVGIGSNEQDNTHIIPQSRVFVHPKYHPAGRDYDIAIIELSQTIDFVNNSISPICIPRNDNKDYTGLLATVSGWGSTVGYNQIPTPHPVPHFPNILQEAEIPVLSNTKCEENVVGLTERMLCAGDMTGFENGGKDACQADSGGPLTVQENSQYQLIGIVSFGVGCASKGNPGVYARVTKFLNWINKIVAPKEIYNSS